MTALFLTRNFPPVVGGMETFSYELTQRYPGPKRVIACPSRRRLDILWIVPLLLVRALVALRTVDVVHLGDLTISPLAPVLKLASRTPIVATAHGLDITHMQTSAGYRLVISQSMQFIDQFAAVSSHSAELLHEAGVPDDRITVIPNGVAPPPELDRVEGVMQGAPPDGSRSEQPFRILTVGRLIARKGVRWFVEAVLTRIRDLDPLLLVVSDGPESEGIATVVAENGLQDHVSLLGRVSSAALEGLYRSADLFVMPNISVPGDVEGFGLVSLEAASRGLPVLAAEIEGITDAVHDGSNGVLVRSGDAGAWEAAIRRLHDDPGARLLLGDGARTYTLRTFSWDRSAAAYERLFEEVAGKHAAAS